MNRNIKVKICGLSREEDIEYVNEYYPDYIGFVFAESKRQIDASKAEKLKKLLHPSIQVVGVFVNEPMENIVTLCDEKIIDMIQLHGDETVQYAWDLQKRVNNPLIRAVRVRNKEQVQEYLSYPSQFLLFDSYEKGIYGGTGNAFPKEFINQVTKPYFLAGGLNSKNAVEELTYCSPYCVDISSGVESNGMKDKEKIKNFIQLIRRM